MGRFEELPHTADLKLRFYGKDLKDLFQTAALGLFSSLTELPKIEGKETLSLSVSAPNKEELLYQWLRHLYLKFAVDEYLLKECIIEEISRTHIKAHASGERYAPARHCILHEIKGITYCDLKVEQEKDGSWQAEAVFDV
mgnify:CR=1 FL=1